MKRFFCTVCQRVKRVRNLPISIETSQAEKVIDRTGQCDMHTKGRVRQTPKVRAFSSKSAPKTTQVTSARKSKRAS